MAAETFVAASSIARSSHGLFAASDTEVAPPSAMPHGLASVSSKGDDGLRCQARRVFVPLEAPRQRAALRKRIVEAAQSVVGLLRELLAGKSAAAAWANYQRTSFDNAADHYLSECLHAARKYSELRALTFVAGSQHSVRTDDAAAREALPASVAWPDNNELASQLKLPDDESLYDTFFDRLGDLCKQSIQPRLAMLPVADVQRIHAGLVELREGYPYDFVSEKKLGDVGAYLLDTVDKLVKQEMDRRVDDICRQFDAGASPEIRPEIR